VFQRPPIKAWRRGVNLKELLCPSKLPQLNNSTRGFAACGEAGCALCPFIKPATAIQINGYKRKIFQAINCRSKSGIYDIACTKCNKNYVGRTAETIESRFLKGHRQDIINGRPKPMPRHFLQDDHNYKRDLRKR
jgi:hypothetical protein